MAPPEATEEWVQRIDTHAPTGDVNGRQELTPLAGVYGVEFSSRVKGMGIGEVKTAPRSPWQNPYVECLDHVE